MTETISPEAFKVLLDRAGVGVKPENLDDMRGAYMQLQAMCERVRKTRGYDSEPAHIFRPASR
ncbi:MAG: hypothetical protein ABTQ30_13020 [Rhizobiaceae bacterium]